MTRFRSFFVVLSVALAVGAVITWTTGEVSSEEVALTFSTEMDGAPSSADELDTSFTYLDCVRSYTGSSDIAYLADVFNTLDGDHLDVHAPRTTQLDEGYRPDVTTTMSQMVLGSNLFELPGGVVERAYTLWWQRHGDEVNHCALRGRESTSDGYGTLSLNIDVDVALTQGVNRDAYFAPDSRVLMWAGPGSPAMHSSLDFELYHGLRYRFGDLLTEVLTNRMSHVGDGTVLFYEVETSWDLRGIYFRFPAQEFAPRISSRVMGVDTRCFASASTTDPSLMYQPARALAESLAKDLIQPMRQADVAEGRRLVLAYEDVQDAGDTAVFIRMTDLFPATDLWIDVEIRPSRSCTFGANLATDNGLTPIPIPTPFYF